MVRATEPLARRRSVPARVETPPRCPARRHADRLRLERWSDTAAGVALGSGRCLLHWDLLYDNVLAADREPWIVGYPAFDLWPALDDGMDMLPAHQDPRVAGSAQLRPMTDALDVDRHRASSWTAARLVQNAPWDIEGGTADLKSSALVIDDAICGPARPATEEFSTKGASFRRAFSPLRTEGEPGRRP